MALSSALTLTDLSDYLAPSAVCIKPVEDLNKLQEPEQGAAAVSSSSLCIVAGSPPTQTEIRIDSTGAYYEHASTSVMPKKLQKAQISLNDCLACSGCITSAESVLVSMQSHEEVYKHLDDHPDAVPILSVAPQSLASLAVRHNLTSATVLAGLRVFFQTRLRFRDIFDTTFARHISLQEGQREWVERSGARDRRKGKERAIDDPIGPLPLLASACPGWVCYAEKTHGELLPFASAVKSPQQIAGTLVKELWGPQEGLRCARIHALWTQRAQARARRGDIYHVSVMPCYDKKLEASRPDFADADEVRDVDCVLTTGEVQRMLDEHGLDLATLAASAPPASPPSVFPLSRFSLLHHAGTSSGSYLHNVLAALLATDPTLRLDVRPVRSDYVDYHLYPSTGGGPAVFKGAQCYGFRNLQNVVRKVGREAGVAVARGALGKAPAAIGRRVVRRSGTSTPVAVEDPTRPYDYIEVMACPGGCVNGGGQLAPTATDDEGMPLGRDWLARVEAAYWASSSASSPPSSEVDGWADEVVAEMVGEGGEPRRRALLRTAYRPVEATEVNGLAVKW
jgi:iron only hydrogenase large subunit-like protein